VSRDYFQYAYVTRDLDAAKEELRRTQGITEVMEMRDLIFPTGRGGEIGGHFIYAFKGALQFELIQPTQDEINLYTPHLPEEGRVLQFHHLGRHFGSRADYDATIAAAEARWPLPVNASFMGSVFAYADSRKDIGHHLEYFCYPPDSIFETVPRN
jgi:hypothetical protein